MIRGFFAKKLVGLYRAIAGFKEMRCVDNSFRWLVSDDNHHTQLLRLDPALKVNGGVTLEAGRPLSESSKKARAVGKQG